MLSSNSIGPFRRGWPLLPLLLVLVLLLLWLVTTMTMLLRRITTRNVRIKMTNRRHSARNCSCSQKARIRMLIDPKIEVAIRDRESLPARERLRSVRLAALAHPNAAGIRQVFHARICAI